MTTAAPMPLARSRHALLCASLLLASACMSPETEPRRVAASKPADADPEPEPKGQRLAAAGVVLELPDDWIVLGESEPNFALAYGKEQVAAHIPVCTIELRRQGPGALPDDARELEPGLFEYRRGALRGRVQTLPGPSGSTIVVHCRAPRSSRQWGAITTLLASQVELEADVELPAPRPAPGPEAIVELCTGTPGRMTTVCARRVDGAVYCGASTGQTLERIALPEPAVEISCAGTSACARAAKGVVHCWTGREAPQPIPEAEGARDLSDANIVDARGRLLRRTQDGLVELIPLAKPELALQDVDRVLARSDAESGCVLRNDELQCWDRAGSRTIAKTPNATGLRRMADRLCIELAGKWICIDESDQRHELEACETRACGCSLIGATRMSCEHEPYEPIDARPLGRISNVIAVSEPCAALIDGTVVCRGPVAGQRGVDPHEIAAIASDLPDIAHLLHLE